ncbi:Cas1p-domain-containing protein, partial [Lentithecium fluviatile CBS 122367]
DAADPFKCAALLNHGHWLHPPEQSPHYKFLAKWQPPGCLLYRYNASEISQCNEKGKILFAGDSVIRQVFWATARKIEGNGTWVYQQRARREMTGDMEFELEGARLKFLWDPWLNASTLDGELNAFRNRRETNGEEKGFSMGPKNQRSVVMLIGGGLSHARHHDADAVARFEHSVDSIISTAYGESIGPINMGTAPATSSDGIGDEIFFAPIIDPIYDILSPPRELTITPDKVDAMNRYLAEQSSHRRLNVLWNYANMTNGRREAYQESGLHVLESVADQMADVLLNLRCNAKSAQREGYPYSRTCCSAYRPVSRLQIGGFAVTFTLLGWILIEDAHRSNLGNTRTTNPRRLYAVFALFLSVCYCYMTDRTQIFNKSPKQPSNLSFGLILGLVLMACLPNIKSVSTSMHPLRRRRSSTVFLPHQQSDEIKGWMQVYLLIYSYTGAESSLDLYELHQIFLAFYLFLSAYGHTMYFLRTRDFSLRRVATILLRVNMLPVLLSFVMDRPYASYYFAPLVSFWFLVVYFTLKRQRQSDNGFRRLLGRIAISVVVATTLIHIPGIRDLTSLFLRQAPGANLDVEAWRHHLATHQSAIYTGLLTALLHTYIHSLRRTNVTHLHGLDRFLRCHFRLLRLTTILFALFALPTFWILARRSPDEEDFNWWMPFLSWVPVLSFVLLRNATSELRRWYCAGFAWVGDRALEMWVLGLHIWMAGDGEGVLSVGLLGAGSSMGDRWGSLVFFTLAFVWVVWHVRDAKETSVAWVVGWRQECNGGKRHEGRKGRGNGGKGVDFEMEEGLPKPVGFGQVGSDLNRRV